MRRARLFAAPTPAVAGCRRGRLRRVARNARIVGPVAFGEGFRRAVHIGPEKTPKSAPETGHSGAQTRRNQGGPGRRGTDSLAQQNGAGAPRCNSDTSPP